MTGSSPCGFGERSQRAVLDSRLLAFLDHGDFFGERSTKRSQGSDKQVDLGEGYFTCASGSEKEFKLDCAATIGNREHVSAPRIFAIVRRFDYGVNVGCMIG
jgi:hypothetical protein